VAAEPPAAQRTDAQEGYVPFPGYRTWYRVLGNRRSGRAPLLALHGGPGSTHHWDVRARLCEIGVPTLVVRGRYDISTDPISATLVNGIAGAREVVLDHSSHTPVLEETGRYLEVVDRFVRENDRKRLTSPVETCATIAP
jgi:pimeloyl-ACP methyl ester carboxylesterase